MKCWPRRSGISETEKYITNQQIKGDEPQRGVQLLFVGFRESSHVILERFCILSLRDGITPGSTRHIRLCANLRVNSHSALWFLSSLLFFCVFSLFFCFLFGFNDLPGRPFWFAHFLVLDRIFHRKFGADWWTLRQFEMNIESLQMNIAEWEQTWLLSIAKGLFVTDEVFFFTAY